MLKQALLARSRRWNSDKQLPTINVFASEMKNHKLIVLGMHRSGTSCLTGLLQEAGLPLGDVVEYAPHNKKGNRENLDIREVNDAVLADNNSSWDCPPDKVFWNEKHIAMRDQVLKRYQQLQIWGFKDPRAVLTLEFWLEGMKRDYIHFIGTFRHPLLVAKSLKKRDQNFTISNAIFLWKCYNEQILMYHRQCEFPMLDFDLEADAYLHSFQKAIRRLNLPLLSLQHEIDFFDNKLRNNTVINREELLKYKPILDPVMPVYEQLKSLS